MILTVVMENHNRMQEEKDTSPSEESAGSGQMKYSCVVPGRDVAAMMEETL